VRPQESEILEDNKVTQAQEHVSESSHSESPHEDVTQDGDNQKEDKKRKEAPEENAMLESNGVNSSASSPQKKSRVDKEEPNFKNLFFTCLPFMNLPQISNICNTTAVPIFVKDINSEIVYANNSFFSFLGDITGVKPNEVSELRSAFNSLLDAGEVEHDKFVLTQEERALITSNIVIQDIACQFAKQWSNLPDGQTVIIALVENITRGEQNLSSNGGSQ